MRKEFDKLRSLHVGSGNPLSRRTQNWWKISDKHSLSSNCNWLFQVYIEGAQPYLRLASIPCQSFPEEYLSLEPTAHLGRFSHSYRSYALSCNPYAHKERNLYSLQK